MTVKAPDTVSYAKLFDAIVPEAHRCGDPSCDVLHMDHKGRCTCDYCGTIRQTVLQELHEKEHRLRHQVMLQNCPHRPDKVVAEMGQNLREERKRVRAMERELKRMKEKVSNEQQ